MLRDGFVDAFVELHLITAWARINVRYLAAMLAFVFEDRRQFSHGCLLSLPRNFEL
jgi:hypothetical protein